MRDWKRRGGKESLVYLEVEGEKCRKYTKVKSALSLKKDCNTIGYQTQPPRLSDEAFGQRLEPIRGRDDSP